MYDAIIESVEVLPRIDYDSSVLSDFVAYLAQNEPVISKYSAVTTEIREFIDNYDFEKEGAFHGLAEDGMKVVKNQIEIVGQVEELFENTGKVIEIINGYCDRYNKSNVVENYYAVVNDLYLNLDSSNVEKYKSQLAEVEQQAQLVVSSFENENKELMMLQSTLLKKRSDIWREDNEKLVYDINSLVRGDTRKVSFSLEELEKRINDAKTKRSNEIKEITDKYHWLTREKYQNVHDGLIAKYMARSEYLIAIASIKKERKAAVWKGIGKTIWSILKGIGKVLWSVLKVFGIVFVVLFTVVKAIAGVFLSSHDDNKDG